MGKEQWIDNLRKRMADHQEPPPEGLWRDIAGSLDGVAPPRRTWRRWAAAAAVAAVVAGSGIWWYSHPEPSVPQVAQNTPQVGTVLEEPVSGVPVPDAEEPMLLAQNTPHRRMVGRPVSAASVASGQSVEMSAPEAIPAVVQSPVPASEAVESAAVPASPAESPVMRSSVAETAVSSDAARQEQEILAALGGAMEDPVGKTSKASMSLFASNDVVGGNMFNSEPWGVVLRAPASVRKETHHFQPFSFGLTVGFPVSNRFKLNTGVVYTRQRSDFTYVMKTQSFKDKQTLHYLGVPVTVSSQLWQTRNLSTYALAGGQADFNVSAHSERNGLSQSMEKDRIQFSAILGVGVQYDFVPSLGVYVEPAAKYYFDNGSDVSNSFKDTPFNFNLQVGLRYNFK